MQSVLYRCNPRLFRRTPSGIVTRTRPTVSYESQLLLDCLSLSHEKARGEESQQFGDFTAVAGEIAKNGDCSTRQESCAAE
jgi:hypothetical protein